MKAFTLWFIILGSPPEIFHTYRTLGECVEIAETIRLMTSKSKLLSVYCTEEDATLEKRTWRQSI